MASSLAPQITAAGITAPDYATILASLKSSFQSIYGSDAYLEPDSQDGQLLAIFASARNDANQVNIAVYNSFSPTYAQDTGLSSIIKINGIRRLVATDSTAVGNVVGQAGTVITNGVVKDVNGNLWDLPQTVTIPGGGSIAVTVIAEEPGALVAPAGTINKINTPSLGWQSFVSTIDAVPGQPVESDAALRRRQTISVSLPAVTPLDSMLASLANLTGVTRLAVYENYTSITDSNGIPPHSISVVIEGGNLSAIAQIIGQKKTPGAPTYGTTTQSYADPVTGIVYLINFYVLATTTIKVAITGSALSGYNSSIATEIKNSVAAYIDSLFIGQPVQFTRMYASAYLNGSADGLTYEITGLTIGDPAPGTSDIIILFNKAATCNPAADVTVTIT